MLLADFAWATGIALTPIFLARSGRPLLLAFVQYTVCAGLAALCSALLESIPPGALAATAPTILFAGVVSGAIAYTIQIFAQAHTPPAEAALILALEGVFAALAGALLLDEHLTAIGAFGCVLILAGAAGGGDWAAVRAEDGQRSHVTKVEKLSLPEARRIALDGPGLSAGRVPRKGHGRAMAENRRPAIPAPDRQRQCSGPRPLPAGLLPTRTL